MEGEIGILLKQSPQIDFAFDSDIRTHIVCLREIGCRIGKGRGVKSVDDTPQAGISLVKFALTGDRLDDFLMSEP